MQSAFHGRLWLDASGNGHPVHRLSSLRRFACAIFNAQVIIVAGEHSCRRIVSFMRLGQYLAVLHQEQW